MEALLPEADRGLARYSGEVRRFGAGEMIFVDLLAPDPITLEAAATGVVATLRRSPLIAEVIGGADQEARQKAAETAFGHLPVLLAEADYAELEKRLQPEALEDRMDEVVAALLGPGGGARQEGLRRDPLGIEDIVFARLASASPVAGAHSGWGRLVSADGRRALVVARAAAPLGDEEAAQSLASLFREAKAALPLGSRLAWTGGHRFYLSNSEALRRDITRVTLLALVLVLAVVAVGVRGGRVVLAAGLAVVAGAVGASAAASLAYGEVSALALVFGAALSGITVDYVIHLHAAPSMGERPREAIRRTYTEAAPSVVVGAATSAAAFLVLLWSEIPAHRQLGLASAAGIVVAAVFSLVAGPAVMVLGRKDEPSVREPTPTVLERASKRYFQFALGRPGAALISCLVVLAGAAMLLPGVRFERDLRRFEAKDPATASDERTITENWGSILSYTMVVVHGRDEGDALSQGESVAMALVPFAGRDAGTVIGVSALLPSPASQKDRLAAWKAFWSKDRVSRLRGDLERAGGSAGFKPGTFDLFLRSLVEEPKWLTAASYRGTAFSSLLDRHLQTGSDGAWVLVALSGAGDPEEPGVVWDDAVRRVVPDAQIVTRRGLADAVVGAARRELERLTIPALVAIGLMLLWYYRSPILAMVGLFPLVGALATTAVVLSLVGEPLSMMNIPVALPIFGLGVDYAVFLMDALKGAPPGAAAAGMVGRRSAPLLTAWFTTLAGGAALMVADHPAARTLGSALVLGEGTSLAFAWLAVPWLVGRRGKMAS